MVIRMVHHPYNDMSSGALMTNDGKHYPGQLRRRIQQIIENQHNPEDAAISICQYLENEGFSLAGNGWLEDDPYMESHL